MKIIFSLLFLGFIFKTIKNDNSNNSNFKKDIILLGKNNIMDSDLAIQIDTEKLESHPGKTCNYSNCPLFQGVCYEEKCICGYGFTSVESQPMIYCNYRQKKRMVAFFLEFFFPLGVGHLYAGKTIMAIIKFTMFIFFFCGLCGELCCISLNINKWQVCSAFVILIDLALWFGLQIVDVVCYAFGFYNDGNGVKMI